MDRSVPATTARSVAVNLSCNLPFSELNRLAHSIESSFPGSRNCVIQFASAHGTEGAGVIAFEVAIVAALSGKRVLFIDTTGKQKGVIKQLANATIVSLDTVLTGERPLNDAVIVAEKTTLFYALLHTAKESTLALNNLSAVQGLLDLLRESYDLVVIDSPSILSDAFGVLIAKIVNGTILVVEAEHTRAPVALQTKRMIQEIGGNVIGSVLNRRRFYIPRILYRILYRGA